LRRSGYLSKVWNPWCLVGVAMDWTVTMPMVSGAEVEKPAAPVPRVPADETPADETSADETPAGEMPADQMPANQMEAEPQPREPAADTERLEPAADTEPREPPDGQVVVGCIPHEPPGFQPRAELLAGLDADGTRMSVLYAATGGRGVGTTQLAAAYARARRAAGWRFVAWVSAEDAGTLRTGLAAVADAAGLSEDGPGPHAADAGLAVRHRLEADGDRCLLVFDGVSDPELLRPFVPADGTARVLITCDEQAVAGLWIKSSAVPIPVDVFTAEEAAAFLAARTGLSDAEGAAEVAGELGRLPLALAQAAAVTAGQHLEYGMYLERLRAQQTPADTAPAAGQPHQAGPAEAILLSLEAVRAADQTGICSRVVEIIAVLSAAGVHRDLLHAAGYSGLLAGDGQIAAPALVDRMLADLVQRSLLISSLDGQIFIAHHLVRRTVRDELAGRELLTSLCLAVASMLEAHANALVGSPDRQAVRDIPEQVVALLASAAVPSGEIDEELARALLRPRFLALYQLVELGDSAPQAIAVGEPLTADLERLLGAGHLDTLNARNSLAIAYQSAGRIEEAIPLFEQTLVDRTRRLGPGHPDTLTAQNNLAAAYSGAGRAQEAILLFELTLAGREQVLGADHDDTLNSRNHLAAVYRGAGRAAEAIPLHEQTLAAREHALGPDHGSTLGARNNLAAAYRDAGRATEAVPLFEQTLAACERLLGADHPRTLSARHNLANAYRDVGRAQEAIPLHEQTLAACEQLLGADHPRTLSARHNLADAYRDVGRAQEAIPLHEQTLAARERALGADHPDTLAALTDLATAYLEAGRAVEAMMLFEVVLAAQERLHGAGHPDTVATRGSLALARREAGGAE
jgi:tetratricopeptide (TPR) repeat protein